ncbi:S41 family peptidase [Aliiglaciecola sp. M165]|uniref:S41 family peptidase n=1 Tax=Aliiglaciecola sp. M165 TaxID=2593649 RepID=UPI00117ED3A8|nr:S41 family peptidase [Aliiglaciecola sp. M165]TRY31541.1 S41 family peptidase [Aliiglaciecola sp. M165]
MNYKIDLNHLRQLALVMLLSVGLLTSVQAKQANMQSEHVKLLIEQTLDVMEENYIEPQVVPQLRQIFSNRLTLGHYTNLSSIKAFAQVIGDDVRAITGDKHLSLYTLEPGEELTHILKHAEGKLTYNYSFEEVRYLSGNIGYLKFNKFHPDENARRTVDAAFQFLQNSNGLIVDLRDTLGGSPWLAQYMLSYFLPMETQLWETIDSNNEILDIIKITDKSAHTKFHGDYPVWVLTSRTTASASELFTGVLQANHKAVVVGDITAGAGFYVGVKKITDELVFRISLSKPVISANQQNWEKTGITPDHEVAYVDALDVAYQLSLNSGSHN